MIFGAPTPAETSAAGYCDRRPPEWWAGVPHIAPICADQRYVSAIRCGDVAPKLAPDSPSQRFAAGHVFAVAGQQLAELR
jgi:hypothetical protein